jgi:4-carboxymuconolactone decarboxylase
MPRIPLITEKSQLAPEFHDHYDRLAARRGQIVGPFRVLLHSPELAVRAGDIGAFLRFDGSLPRDVAEIVILTAAREMDARYVWGDHTLLGRQAGVREACIQAIGNTPAGGQTIGLTPEEAELVEYVQELVRTNRVSEAKSKALEARLGLAGLVEVVGTIAYYRALACVLNTYQIDADAGKDVLPNS